MTAQDTTSLAYSADSITLDSPSPAGAGEQASPTPRPTPNVLAVDDRPLNLTLIEAVLAPLGVNVLRAHTAEEGLELARSHDISVVLMDVEMPGRNGFDAARMLRGNERSSAVPIIFITAADYDRALNLASYAAGAVDIIYKPLDTELLRAKVGVFLELDRLRSTTRLEQSLRDSEQRAATQGRNARADAKRLASEQAAILAALPEVVCVVDRDGRYLKTLGPHHIPGTDPNPVAKLMAEVLPGNVADLMVRAVGRALDSGVPQDVDFSVQDIGRTHSFLSRIIRMSPERALCVAHDITARKDAEGDRDARIRYHEAILAATNEILWDVDLETGHVNWSDALAVAFGEEVRVAASTTDGWRARVHPDDRLRIHNEWDSVIHNNGGVWSSEYRFERVDGSYATVLIRAIVLPDAEGRPTKLVGSMLDLSERHQLEAQLRQSQKMEALGQLAGGVAHDFNNLLTVITSYASMSLKDMAAEDVEREAMEQIAGAAERAASLTRQLLTFSHQGVRRTEVLGLNECLVASELLLRRLVREDIEITTSLTTDPCAVNVDPQQVGQILVNLAVNAGDAMPNGGTLTIRTDSVTIDHAQSARASSIPPGRYAQLSITDTGTGISAHALEHIFEPFFTTKGLGKGTGLGLATVYGIVRQSMGHVNVTSKEGFGTTFEILFPLVTEVPRRKSVPVMAAARGSETILVVDDDTAVRTVVVRILTRGGYTVHAVANGAEALAHLDTGGSTPGLLLTDVVMPTMGARELLPAILARAADMCVLLMSGYNTDRIDEADWAVGASFLEKPFTGDQLLQRVREVLDASDVVA
jgi:signal transduction histidine kinase/DNA-binding response OmpR family regulator